MRKNLKIFISILLVLCFLATPASVLAAAITEVQNDSLTLGAEVGEETENNISYVQSGTEIETKGKLEITVAFDLPISNKTERKIRVDLVDRANSANALNLEVSLNKANSYTDTKIGEEPVSVSIEKINKEGKTVKEGEEYHYLNIIVDGVPKNTTYDVAFSGKSFINYNFTEVSNSNETNTEERMLNISNYSKRLVVSDTKGTFAIGDVTADGKITEDDYNELQKQIGIENPDLETYDLNSDGIVDVIDLSYIANNIESENENANIQMTNPIISTAKVKVSVENKDTNIVEGTVADLLNPETDNGVKLETKNAAEITTENPVALTIDYTQRALNAEYIKIEGTENSVPTQMLVTVETEDGTTYEMNYPEDTMAKPAGVHALSIAEAIMLGEVSRAEGKTIVIDLGKQVAVKKITIKITKVSSNTPNLAEVSTVELLNNVYEDLPAPDMSIPEGLELSATSETIIANWYHASNVTGYMVRLTDESGKVIEYSTTNNTYTFSKLTNYKTYTVEVQSVNGSWKSGYSDAKSATPVPNGLPPVPESINLKGAYKRVSISWKDMKDTVSYILYYRKAGELNYKSIPLTQTSYTVNDLEENTDYQFQVAGVNELGTGPKSSMYTCRTTDLTLPKTSNYKLINRVVQGSEVTEHIKSVNGTTNQWATVDNDYSTYWKLNSWDAGGFNNGRPAPIIEFDEEYEMDRMIVIPAEDQPYNYAYGRIIYWDANGKQGIIGAEAYSNPFVAKTSNGKRYYEANLPEPIKAKKIQIGFALGSTTGYVTISEMKFYHYDSLEADIAALYNNTGDNAGLRIELSDEMKNLSLANIEAAHAKVEELRQRANTNDPVSDEPHPRKDTILEDLLYLDRLIDDEASLAKVITVDQNVSNNYNKHLGFSFTLNDMQPLGIVAKPSETGNSDDSQIVVYVGASGNSVGDSVPLQVVFTQYFPEYSAWQSSSAGLKVGKNVISVPNIAGNRDGAEAGGAVYIKYTGTSATNSKTYKVRVSGGEKIPVLDIHGNMTEEQIKSVITEYVNELESHVANLPDGNKTVQVLNSTDIVMPSVMLSIPADRALAGLGNASSVQEKANTLYKSYLAWEEMIGLFYKEKGLTEPSRTNNTNTEKMNALPGSRLNIRYTRMFDGAFMYAAGMHIGVGYGSTTGLTCGKPISDSGWNGYFGWGISHEIGHVIDQSGYAIAETTNNIYSLFAQTANDKAASRLEYSNIYPKIYEKVTSHTEGISGNVFTHLGMYWQLHLAYDNGSTKTEKDTFYSRLHTLYRTDKSAAASMESKDRLVCYSSKAAGKDLTEFFEIWGIKLTNSANVAQYMKDNNLEKETRAIYYLNDDARRYRLNGGTGLAGQNIGFTAGITNRENINQNKEVEFSFDVNSGSDSILGYEILRNGVSVGFTTDKSFTDNLNAINNRVLKYEAIAYDKLLNEVGKVNLGEIKVQNDGTVTKSNFTAVSNMINKDLDEENITDTDALGSVGNVIDGDLDTVFIGNKAKALTDAGSSQTASGDPYIIIELNASMPVCGIRYRHGENLAQDLLDDLSGNYEIQVSTDNQNWTTMRTISKLEAYNNDDQVIYFDQGKGEGQLVTATCGYVKIIAKGSSYISAAEIDIISPSGDNIDFVITEDGNYNDGVYKLAKDFTYETVVDEDGNKQTQKIDAGSVVIKATYKGFTLYNEALIKVRHDNSEEYVYPATEYSELFMAPLPTSGDLLEVKDGTCLIWMSEAEYEKLWTKEDDTKGTKTFGKLELYRVDDAISSDGQRLVSDSFEIEMPSYGSLTEIELRSDSTNN